MDVRARARRALTRPSPRVRLTLMLVALIAGFTAALAVTVSLDPSTFVLGGGLALGGASALALTTRIRRSRERHRVVEVLEAAERARLLREFVAAREMERRGLWERLHDEVLQTTAGNLLRLDAARVLLEEGRIEQAGALMAEAGRTERQIFDDLRKLMAGMNVDPLGMPHVDPLQVLVAIPEREPAAPPGG